MARATELLPMDPNEMGFGPQPPITKKKAPTPPREPEHRSQVRYSHEEPDPAGEEPRETEPRPVVHEARMEQTGTFHEMIDKALDDLEPKLFADFTSDVRHVFRDYSTAALKDQRIPLEEPPTYCQYYDFKTINIRPLAYIDLQYIMRAQKTKNEALILDVVQSCIDVPLAQLTFGDLIFILHWLRKNSYTRSPQIVTWKCAACEDRWRAKTGEQRPFDQLPRHLQTDLDEARESVQKLIAANSTTVIDIDPPIACEEGIDVPRVAVYLEHKEFCRLNPEHAAFANIALYVKGDTMGEKFAKLESAPGLDLWERARQMAAAVGDHGISDYVNLECHRPTKDGECGAKTVRFLAVQLLTFLS